MRVSQTVGEVKEVNITFSIDEVGLLLNTAAAAAIHIREDLKDSTTDRTNSLKSLRAFCTALQDICEDAVIRSL